ncbi:MAG: NAD(P)H-dependent oxidoreductase subunit E [Desulfobacterales bacterium]|nr:NAD(P)H-dependent oxidoreductase subunit E [Desulfobacterales bacterium]
MKREKVQKIVGNHRHEKAALLAILHEIQEDEKQIDMESIQYLSELMKVPAAHIYGIVTFYSAFTTGKKGETEIKMCDGISCHLNGADEVTAALKSRLHIKTGETTQDGKYSLENVHCLGLCCIGPNATFNHKTYCNLNKEKIIDILQVDIRK